MNERDIRDLTGLGQAEVDDRRRRYGPNQLPDKRQRGILRIVLEVFTEPMFLLLVVCGALYLFLGEPQDAAMLLGFVVIMMAITVVQEGKTEKTLDALRNLSSPRALVIRGGERYVVAGPELVPDDLVVLAEGERVPADGILLWGTNLSVDESLLTGESLPVDKLAVAVYPESDGPMARPGGEDSPYLYSGSLVVSGQGVFRVRGTGAATEMGKIGQALGSVEAESTPLQKETGKIVRTIFIVAAALCLLTAVVFGLTRGDWLGGVLAGITLAMAMLPEEFPVVLTIFLALGAWRISKKQVLARRMSAVETLGAATVLCSDKTGTITQNKMSVAALWLPGGAAHAVDASRKAELPEEFHGLVEAGILASRKDPFDPMEKAFVALGDGSVIDEGHLHPAWDVIREYPLSREFLSVTNVLKAAGDGRLEVAAKGAPETVMDLCHLPEGERAAAAAEIARLAGRGLRILGVARGRYALDRDLPAGQHDFDFEFLGLVGLADPIRPAVPDAVKLCREAGVRVVMITGDYPKTAANIARQIGLDDPDLVTTGAEIEAMGEAELRGRVKSCQVFARVVPEQKLALVRALQAAGETVAMTGDGVNDAPALKAADIGVAMGQRGTDVAREASALVLLDDDFSSIVAAVRTGRRIFDNLKKAMSYIVSVHVPIAGMSLLPVLLQWKEVALQPVHIVFLELLIDPACSIIFEGEPEEADIMNRPPRASGESLFSRRTVGMSLAQGASALAMVLVAWFGAGALGFETDAQRALAFIALVASNLAVILANRSWKRSIFAMRKVANPSVNWIIGGVAVFLALIVAVPFLRSLFHFAAVPAWAYLAAAAAGFASVAWFEIYKVAAAKRGKALL
jgi:Ca2+-transporting ATPase